MGKPATSLQPRGQARHIQARTIPSTYSWEFTPKGQHLELGIAEINLFIMLSALGLSHSLFGERFIPIGTLYDPFIERGLDALNYACYQDARFIVAATPSGVTLAPEGGAHQSIGTPLIGLKQDGLAAFEPAFVDELSSILRWSSSTCSAMAKTWQTSAPGCGMRQVVRSICVFDPPDRAAAPDDDGRVGRRNRQWRLLDAGARSEHRSADRLSGRCGAGSHSGGPHACGGPARRRPSRNHVRRSPQCWMAGRRTRAPARQSGRDEPYRAAASTAVARLRSGTVLDGHPATLAWLGAVHGHRTKALGVEHFGQTGTIADLYRHHGIDTNAIVHAANAAASGRPVRHLKALP